MVIKKLSISVFLGTVIEHIQKYTEIKCVPDPDNVKSPLYSLQLTDTEQRDTKTMFVDRFNFSVHCISEAPKGKYSPISVLEMVTNLEEAMTETIQLDGFNVLSQTCKGLSSLKKDPSGEGHAVVDYSIDVCYGFKVK